jgi:hypothetical protein
MTDREYLPNFIDGIIEAKLEAQRMGIKVNMVFINDRLAFSRIKTDCYDDVPIVCGLKAAYTTELPDDVLFAVAKADTPPKTKDERFAEFEAENQMLCNKLKQIIRVIKPSLEGDVYDR